MGTLRDQMDDEGVNEYLEYAGLGDMSLPAALVAPYFYMQASTLDKWLDVNVRLLAQAAASVTDRPLLAELVIERDILVNSEHVERLVEQYGGIDHDGVLLWIDDFSEVTASLEELRGFRDLSRGLRDAGRPVVNLYGGYLSMVLCSSAGDETLAGVCHGLEYGEDRAVVPVGGGVPTAKFYLTPLHVRLRYQDAVRAVRGPGWLASKQTFIDHVCDCSTCHQVVGSDPNTGFFGYGRTVTKRDRLGRAREYPLAETRENTLNHNLQAKAAEWEFLSHATRDDVIAQLEKTALDLREHVGVDQVAHLETWAAFLRKL
jgi:hypothetical protein